MISDERLHDRDMPIAAYHILNFIWSDPEMWSKLKIMNCYTALNIKPMDPNLHKVQDGGLAIAQNRISRFPVMSPKMRIKMTMQFVWSDTFAYKTPKIFMNYEIEAGK